MAPNAGCTAPVLKYLQVFGILVRDKKKGAIAYFWFLFCFLDGPYSCTSASLETLILALGQFSMSDGTSWAIKEQALQSTALHLYGVSKVVQVH